MFPDRFGQSLFMESKLSDNKRDNLKDSEFGIPAKRAYPLNDKSHVEAAVRMFPHADDSDKKELAKRIISKAKEFNMDTSGWDSLNEYIQESVERINFVHWLTERNIVEIASGLWFGGENGWELLSNETTSVAIDAAINAKIATLTVGGYAQATMNTNVVAGDKTDSKLIDVIESNSIKTRSTR